MEHTIAHGEVALTQAEGDRVLRRVAWRLVPFMCLLYLLAYLDRVNVGFASLQMTKDLGLSDRVFGFGAGVFFIGYFLFEVPSNLILHRVGARRWIARIMVTWGLVAAGMMFIRGPASFYGMRILLGAAEAGFFPGMVLFLSYWFPARYRARMAALFFASSGVAGMVGGPLSGLLLSMDGIYGLHGWQWLFLLEGLPSVFVGFLVYWGLTDRPSEAKWLSAREARWVEEELERDYEGTGKDAAAAGPHGSLRAALTDKRLWLLTASFSTLSMGGYAAVNWMPKVLKEVTNYSDAKVGLLCAVPFGVAVASMILVGRHSDKTGERRLHVAGSLATAGIGLACTPFCTNLPMALVALSMAVSGIWCALGPFWAIPGEFLRGTAAAGGIAAVNSVGNLGGFVGPYVVGYVRDRFHGFNGGLILVGACVMGGAALIAYGARKVRPQSD